MFSQFSLRESLILSLTEAAGLLQLHGLRFIRYYFSSSWTRQWWKFLQIIVNSEKIKNMNIFFYAIILIPIHWNTERQNQRQRDTEWVRERKTVRQKTVIVVGGVSSSATPIRGTSSSRLNDLEPASPNGSVWTGSFPGCGSWRLISKNPDVEKLLLSDSPMKTDLESECVGC